MRESATLTSQEWYRVRRGEDEIAWGKMHTDPELPNLVLSHRCGQELAFLEPQQREAVRQGLRELASSQSGESGVPVVTGSGRRVLCVGRFRIVYRVDPEAEVTKVSTIRGGKVSDPENVGSAPRWGD